MEAAKETTPCTPPKDGPVGPDGKKLKPCCACPETKRPRDECIMEKVGVSYRCQIILNIANASLLFVVKRVRRTAES